MKLVAKLLVDPLFLDFVQSDELEVGSVCKGFSGVFLFPLVHLSLMDRFFDLLANLILSKLPTLLLIILDNFRDLLDPTSVFFLEAPADISASLDRLAGAVLDRVEVEIVLFLAERALLDLVLPDFFLESELRFFLFDLGVDFGLDFLVDLGRVLIELFVLFLLFLGVDCCQEARFCVAFAV